MTTIPILRTSDAPGTHRQASIRRSIGFGALRAIVYREFLLLTRNRTNLLLSIVPTMIYLLLFSTSLTRMVGTITYHGTHVPYPEFAVPAIMFSSMLSAASATGTSLFQEEIGGMAVEIWSYPVSRVAYLGGKIVTTTALVLAQSLAALLLGVLIFRLDWPASHWLALGLATIVASLVFNGLFLLLASFIRDFQRFMVLINVVGPLLLFSSPSFYPVEQMPRILRLASAVNPVTYGVNSVRDGAILGLGAMWRVTLGLFVVAVGLMAVIATVLTRRARDL